jgi:hypothetical protein
MSENFKSGLLVQAHLHKRQKKLAKYLLGSKSAKVCFKDNVITGCVDSSSGVTSAMTRVQQRASRNSIATVSPETVFKGLSHVESLPLRVFYTQLDRVKDKKKYQHLVRCIKADVLHHRDAIKASVQAHLKAVLMREDFQLLIKMNVSVRRKAKGAATTKTVLYGETSERLVEMLCDQFYSSPLVLKRSIVFSPHIAVSSHGPGPKRKQVQMWIADSAMLMTAQFVV